MSVGTRPVRISASTMMLLSSVRCRIDSSMRAGPARWRVRARARQQGFFPPFLPSRLAAAAALPSALRVICAPFTPSSTVSAHHRAVPLLCMPRVPSRSRTRRVARAVPSPRRKIRRGSSTIAPSSPPPARHIYPLCRPEITIVTVKDILTIQ